MADKKKRWTSPGSEATSASGSMGKLAPAPPPGPGGLSGWLPPARSMSCGVQCPPMKSGSVLRGQKGGNAK
eukprot:scaffold21064_cov110-Isochrysis_galbana.AAC.2